MFDRERPGRAAVGAIARGVLAALIAGPFAGCAERLPAPPLAAPPAAAAKRDVGPLVALGWVADRVDAVSDRVRADGAVDFAFRVRISGPIRALVLVSSDARGTPCCGDVWDTLRPPHEMPAAAGLPPVAVAATWSLAVFDASAKLLNPQITLPETTFRDEHLTIFAADPSRARFAPGRSLTLLVARPDGSVDRATTTLL